MPSLLHGRTPAIRDGTPRSIAALERMTLGGVEQWLTLRGHDTSLPLLLYVHGGPGTPDLGAMRHFAPELEQHFLVAHWCQRGGGKSYTRGLSDDRMTMVQFLGDLEELCLRLLQRFGQPRLFLVGQSWGTALGMRLLARRPDLVAAFVGVNQVVDRAEEELRTHRVCLARARERGNRKAVAQLEALGEPTDGMYASVQGTLVQRGWVRSLGMVTCEPAFAMELGKAIAMSPEVTVRDLFVLFPRSGHVACFEEPRRFLEVMLRAKAASASAGVDRAP